MLLVKDFNSLGEQSREQGNRVSINVVNQGDNIKMGALNFKKLRNQIKQKKQKETEAGKNEQKNAAGDKGHKISENEHRTQSSAEMSNTHKSSMNEATSPPKTKSLKTKSQKVYASNSLLASHFCYGCPLLSVDAPFTDKEQCWCVRPGIGGKGYRMLLIKEGHLISQCPLVKTGERGLNLLVEIYKY